MIGLHEDPFSTPPPEPLKTQVLRLLLLTYTVWCDADHLRIRPKQELCGDPHAISWAEAMILTGMRKPVERETDQNVQAVAKEA